MATFHDLLVSYKDKPVLYNNNNCIVLAVDNDYITLRLVIQPGVSNTFHIPFSGIASVDQHENRQGISTTIHTKVATP